MIKTFELLLHKFFIYNICVFIKYYFLQKEKIIYNVTNSIYSITIALINS